MPRGHSRSLTPTRSSPAAPVKDCSSPAFPGIAERAILEIVLIYHFDGHTYGPVPNSGEANNNCTSSYGIDAMRQMIIIQKGA